MKNTAHERKTPSQDHAAPWGGELVGEAFSLSAARHDGQDDEVPWTIEKVCNFMGGFKPTNPATIYKWIKKKGFPKPFKPGPRTSRWLPSEVRAYRQNKIAWRDKTSPDP